MSESLPIEARLDALPSRGGRLDVSDLPVGARVVHADAVRHCLMSQSSFPHARAVEVADITIVGELDLSHVVLDRPVQFDRCSFESAVDVTGARIHSVRLDRCRIPVLRGSNLRTGYLGLVDSNVAESINLITAQIDGQLNASGLQVGRPVDQWDATQIVPEESLGYSLEMYGIDVRGGLLLWKGTPDRRATFERGLSLLDGTVRGQLTMAGSRLGTGPRGCSALLSQTEIGGSLFLFGAHASAQIDAEGSTVGGSVFGAGAELNAHPSLCSSDQFLGSWRALTLANARIGGDVRFGGGFTAHGMVDLSGARVGGTIAAFGLFHAASPQPTVDELGDVSLRLDLCSTQALFLQRGFRSEGRVRLFGASVAGAARLNGGDFVYPNHIAIDGDTADIGGNLRLTHGHVEGSVRFGGATFGGNVRVGGTWGGDGTRSLDLGGATVAKSLWLGVAGESTAEDTAPAPFDGVADIEYATVEGELDASNMASGTLKLGSATIGSLTLPSAGPIVELSRTRYGGLAFVDSAHGDIRAFLDTAERSNANAAEFTSYADHLERAGNRAGAMRLRIAREKRSLRDAPLGRRLLGRIHHATSRFGFQPLRAAGLLGVTVVAIAALSLLPQVQRRVYTVDDGEKAHTALRGGWLTDGETAGGAERCGVQYSCFNSITFAVDTVVPLVELDRVSDWRPLSRDFWGWLIRVGLWFGSAIGWVLSTMFVAGIGRLVRDR